MKTNRMLLVSALLILNVLLFAKGEQESATAGPVKITWHQVGNPQNELPVVMDEVNSILENKLNANLDIIIHGWGDFDTKMQTIHAAGEEFDLAYTSSWTNNFIATARKGAYKQLDELLPRYGQDILKQVPEKFWDVAKLDGKIFAVINMQIMANYRGIAFVTEYLEKYGFDPTAIKKNTDIIPYLEKIKANEPDVLPFFPYVEGIYATINPATDPISFDPVYGSHVGGVVAVGMTDPTRTVVNTVKTDIYRENVQTMRDLLEKGIISPDFITLSLDEEVKGKTYAAFVVGNAKPGVDGENKVRYGKDTVTIGLHRPYVSTGSSSATMTAIGANSRHAEKAMEIYNAIYGNKELYNLLVFGMRGVHYELKDGNYAIVNSEKPYGLPAWEFGNQFNAYLLPGQEPDVWENTEKLNNNSVVSPLLGFIFDQTAVKNEIAAVDAIEQERGKSIFYEEDLDAAIAEYIDALDKAGVDKIITEAQRQIDEWVANK